MHELNYSGHQIIYGYQKWNIGISPIMALANHAQNSFPVKMDSVQSGTDGHLGPEWDPIQ